MSYRHTRRRAIAVESYRCEERRVTAAFGSKALIVPPGSRPGGGI